MFCRLVIFWVVLVLSEDFTVRARKRRSDNKRLTKNDDSQVCDVFLQIGHLLSRNGVK